MNFRQTSTDPVELVFGVIGPVGCNRELVIATIEQLARHFSYTVQVIKVSTLIAAHIPQPAHDNDDFARVWNLMQAGNALREATDDNALMAKLAAKAIAESRGAQVSSRTIYIINSIKRPEEIQELRDIYGSGFYLFAIHSSETIRQSFLEKYCHISDPQKRLRLIERDKSEDVGFGQNTSEAFHLADFFLSEDGNHDKIWNTMERFFDIILGAPFQTPTFNEFAMFMAYGASIRSVDMSRQVGAVVTHDEDIISAGANECPRPFGGTYWPLFDAGVNRISDVPGGRDYTRGVDRNALEKRRIVDALMEGLPADLASKLEDNILKSGLNDITEYGRVVHAEMDAILGCARRWTCMTTPSIRRMKGGETRLSSRPLSVSVRGNSWICFPCP